MPTSSSYDKSSAHAHEHNQKQANQKQEHPPEKIIHKEGQSPEQLAAIAPGASIPTTTTLAAFLPMIFTNKSAALVDANLRVTAIDAQSFICDWGTAQQPTAAYMYVFSRPIAPNTIAVQ